MIKLPTLLSKGDHKTIKGEKFGYITYILYMSPYTDNSKGINLCPHASAGCAASCLFKSGLSGVYPMVAAGRRNKTERFISDRKLFIETLANEISKVILKHEDTVVIRLNGTSDIRWEKLSVFGYANIFEAFPDIQFYDYTKNPLRMVLDIPNYHLTFSRSENNDKDCKKVLALGRNVAMVFRKRPTEYMGYPVINGDESDLRFKDPEGVIVGLTYKSATGTNGKAANAKSRISGFVIEQLQTA